MSETEITARHPILSSSTTTLLKNKRGTPKQPLRVWAYLDALLVRHGRRTDFHGIPAFNVQLGNPARDAQISAVLESQETWCSIGGLSSERGVGVADQ